MSTLRNILVVQDASRESSKAIEIAAHLQRQMQVRVSIVDVVSEKRSNDAIDVRRNSLNAIVDASSLDVDRTRISILCGRPISVLIDEVINASHDLLLKDAFSNSEGLFLGALDLRLLQLSPATVWLTGPDSAVRPKTIMVAVSPDLTEDTLNGELLSLGARIAEIDASEIYVVCSADLEKEDEEGKEEFMRHLYGLLKQKCLRLPADRIIISKGLPSDCILDACLEIQPDLLLMGTVAKRDVPGLWLGGTADAVARQIRSSLVGIKPSDFCPVLPRTLSRLN